MKEDLQRAQAALDAERELSAAWAEKARQYELELDGDPQNFHGQGRTIGVREQLSQLQALVRALPKKVEALSRYRLFPSGLGMHPTGPLIIREDVLKELIVLAATLDATPPAKEQVKHEK